MEAMKWTWQMWVSLSLRALDVMLLINCGPEYIYILAVISCGTDHKLQSVMTINTLHQVHKNLINVCITVKASVDNTQWVSSTCYSVLIFQLCFVVALRPHLFGLGKPRQPSPRVTLGDLALPSVVVNSNNRLYECPRVVSGGERTRMDELSHLCR